MSVQKLDHECSQQRLLNLQCNTDVKRQMRREAKSALSIQQNVVQLYDGVTSWL